MIDAVDYTSKRLGKSHALKVSVIGIKQKFFRLNRDKLREAAITRYSVRILQSLRLCHIQANIFFAALAKVTRLAIVDDIRDSFLSDGKFFPIDCRAKFFYHAAIFVPADARETVLIFAFEVANVINANAAHDYSQ